MNLELVYSQKTVRDFLLYGLIGYANSNIARDPEDRKLVMGYCFFFNGVVVLWKSKKKWTVSKSTIKIKYIALANVVREVVWIKKFFNELELEVIKTITLHSNNKMSIALTKNGENQYCTKHINV